jgi:peptidyl-prolyl cis-trans isomerase SurA
MVTKGMVAKAFVCAVIPYWLISTVAVGHSALIDRIVAIVNDDVITLSELDEAVEPYAARIRDSLHGPREQDEIFLKLRQDILNGMIDQKLTDQESARLGVSVEDSEVDERIEQIMSAQSMSKEELEKTLDSQGYTLEDYRHQLKEQMLRMNLINLEVKSKIAITGEEIENYYDKHKEDYQEKKKYHLRTILVKVSSVATADERDKALKKIRAVAKEFEAGVGFDELARRYSDDRTAKDGGDLGLFDIDELSREFRETVRGMKEGQISPILETPQGHQIVMLEQIKSQPGMSLEEAKIQIQEKLYNDLVEQKYQTWLKGLRERSYIEIID